MPSDYQKQIKEIFGTADLDELRELAKMLKINHPNPRNAGRKAQLTPDQTVEVLELHRKGIGNTEIAKQFGVSRQTIYKYIYNAEHFSTDPDFTMRMNFMNGQQLCTVIDIDFKHESCPHEELHRPNPFTRVWRCRKSVLGGFRGIFERKMPARQPSRFERHPPGDGCSFL